MSGETHTRTAGQDGTDCLIFQMGPAGQMDDLVYYRVHMTHANGIKELLASQGVKRGVALKVCLRGHDCTQLHPVHPIFPAGRA